MSKDGLRARSYLGHILEAIQRINRYTRDMTEASFLENELVQDAVIRNIEIIGEAVPGTVGVRPLRIECGKAQCEALGEGWNVGGALAPMTVSLR
ncbi:MAG: DUF86 domain-containing protein [Betaproteobacteria bacterium]|nr:DUF86 domain-containing protein [Betaproteobacteria bacterium]